MKKLYLQTYGCQMNQYDSERIAQVMEPYGLRRHGSHRDRRFGYS